MVLIRNNVTKESTYGWYPPQLNVYETTKAKSAYDKECLFNFWKSGLLTAQPEYDKISKIVQQEKLTPSKPAKILSKTPTPAIKKQDFHEWQQVQNLEPFISRPPSTSSRTAAYRTSGQNKIPTPSLSRQYHGWQPQSTIISIAAPVSEKSDQFIVSNSPNNVQSENDAEDTRNLTPANEIRRMNRVKSAAINRPRTMNVRKIKSATMRTKSAVPPVTPSVTIDTSPKPADLKDMTPNVDVYEIMEDPRTPTLFEEPVSYGENFRNKYDENLKKYGWRAEVHGDPLNLKILAERLPYAYECKEPQVEEDPYKTKVTLGETFFYNTIPRKRWTFTVNPEWQSEHFVEQRKELEKQGRKFHMRDYAFAY